MSFLAEFYRDGLLNRALMVMALWVIWPGAMLIVGVIFESRIVPLGKQQSRAFFPGDLSFAVMLVALFGMYAKNSKVPLVDSWLYWAIAVLVVVTMAREMQASDVANYPARARTSPTKAIHDMIGYFVIPLLLVGFGLPQLLVVWKPEVLILSWPEWLVFAAGMGFYTLCVGVDSVKHYSQEDIYARHPYDWEPIWKTRKLRE